MRIIRILSNALKGRMLVPAFRLNIVVFTVANCDKSTTGNSKWEVFSSVHHLTHVYFFLTDLDVFPATSAFWFTRLGCW